MLEMFYFILSILFPQRSEPSDFCFAESSDLRENIEVSQVYNQRQGVYRFEKFSTLFFPYTISGCHRYFTKNQMKKITSYFTKEEWDTITEKDCMGRDTLFWSQELQGYEFIPLYDIDVLLVE